jgi:hypothetical protein
MGSHTSDSPEQEPLIDSVATDDLIGFFALLLEVDVRNNPERYKAATAFRSCIMSLMIAVILARVSTEEQKEALARNDRPARNHTWHDVIW